jgi:hypothetical protein
MVSRTVTAQLERLAHRMLAVAVTDPGQSRHEHAVLDGVPAEGGCFTGSAGLGDFAVSDPRVFLNVLAVQAYCSSARTVVALRLTR